MAPSKPHFDWMYSCTNNSSDGGEIHPCLKEFKNKDSQKLSKGVSLVKSMNGKCFESEKKLQLVYISHESAWVTQALLHK